MPPKVKKQKENVKGKQLNESESSNSDNESDISTEVGQFLLLLVVII